MPREENISTIVRKGNDEDRTRNTKNKNKYSDNARGGEKKQPRRTQKKQKGRLTAGKRKNGASPGQYRRKKAES